MKSFVCIVLLATAALAAPEGKRDKRGYLSGLHGSSLDSLSLHSGYDSLDSGHGLGSLSYGHGYETLGSGLSLDHAPIYSAPTKIISTHKVVQVPKVVEVKRVVSVPKVVSVPQLVKVSKIVQEPSISYSSHNSGWW